MSLPTGYGKSICYAILPSVFDRIKGRCMVCVIEYAAIELSLLHVQLQGPLEVLSYALAR